MYLDAILFYLLVDQCYVLALHALYELLVIATIYPFFIYFFI